MNETKKKLIAFVLFFVLFSSLPFIGLYIYDPLQVFHKHWHQDDVRLHGNMRLQAAGVINNYEFDSLILGTSMMKGSSAKLASKLLGGNFVNLSSDGSTIFERSLILKYALQKNKEIKKVIFSFDTGLDVHNLRSPKKYPLKNFEMLYDNSFLNDFQVYWNDQKLVCMFSWSYSSECIGNKRGLQRDMAWFESIHQRNEGISGLNNWLTEKGRGVAVYSRLHRHIKKHTPNKGIEPAWKLIVQKTFLPIVDKYENTEFHIVFPPYSRFLTSIWQKYNTEKYLDYKKVIEVAVLEAETRDNLIVHNFDSLDYVENLNNYRDMRHYNVDMNIMMVESISEKSSILEKGSLQQHLDDFDAFNLNYNHDEELDKIINYYKTKK